MIKTICDINGTSGDESKVREYIIKQIKDYCTFEVDNLGSIIAYKKGANIPNKKIMFSAHMDEVGFIVNYITKDGFIKISPVGGIDAKVVIGNCISINGLVGVVGTKPIHLLSDAEKKSSIDFNDIYVDFGFVNDDEANQKVKLGDFGYFINDYYENNNSIISKALDDRLGCLLLIDLIKSDLKYDTYFCFNVQEEIGLRGATCTSNKVNPDIAVVVESTTAADIYGVDGYEKCCIVGNGPVISYMDNRTVYDRELYSFVCNLANSNNIKIQTKTKIAGGNDAGAIQVAGSGTRVIAISLPCRYIHTGSSLVLKNDLNDTKELLFLLVNSIYD